MKWRAYQSNESGRSEIYVQPFPAPSRRTRITTGGGTAPRWTRGGRETEREGLCLSDYFLPAESSKFDVVAFQVVTVGPRADELSNDLNARGEYAQSLFVHGLGVSAAEGLAEWHHGKIRRELGIEPTRGLRYSFGYSACPDLADQAKMFALLRPEKAIGVTLTSAWQLVPEASTSAIVVHHPAATYYLVKA